MNNSIDIEHTIATIHNILQNEAKLHKSNAARFFKTGAGEYAEHDRFIGVSVPFLRKLSLQFESISLEALKQLISSKINEERLLALLILIRKYEKSSKDLKKIYYQFYLDNLHCVNNWNLVDASAHLMMGAHLSFSNKAILLNLAQSKIIWERRIAIVSTWYFIRQGKLEWTFKIAEVLLNDSHDLIHKAVGWMLREAGKQNEESLILFLNQYAERMPRTMLRYAIEKFPESKRKSYLIKK